MQLNRCPVCHARIGLEAMVQDEAGRELLGLLVSLDSETGWALVGYLALFRSSTRDLSQDKALKLAKEALALGGNIAQAMRQTVESLQGKGGKPLTNHNYLKRVLEDCQPVGRDKPLGVPGVTHTTPETLTLIPAYKGKPSKTAQALQALEDFGNE